jgi:hypothetical protein
LVIVAGLSYLGLSYVLDGFTRTLLQRTVRELKNVIIRGSENLASLARKSSANT